MKVIVLKPHQYPIIEETDTIDLNYLQSKVDGYIEAVYPWNKPLVLFCNEEGKLVGLPFNRFLMGENNQIRGTLEGDLVICGDNCGECRGLTDGEIDFLLKYYDKDHAIIRGKSYVTEYGMIDEAWCDKVEDYWR